MFMNNQGAMPPGDGTDWHTILRELARELNGAGVRYTVVGGTSLALHGVAVQVKDIDIETDIDGFYRCAELWAGHLVGTAGYASSTRYRSHFGRFVFRGVQVELMAGLEWLEDERWQPVHSSTLEIIDLEGIAVNVSWLEEETLAYIRRGRLDRAALCLAYCDHHRLLKLLRGQQMTRVLG